MAIGRYSGADDDLDETEELHGYGIYKGAQHTALLVNITLFIQLKLNISQSIKLIPIHPITPLTTHQEEFCKNLK